ncbi:hypothetical protein KGY71_03285, partial [Candidatus Bipolaricaulota bacterium]|nr:hypothetical protein [Candidatus Bipolaricaulota bacterium]
MNLAIMSVGQSSVCPDLNATVNSRYYQKSLGQHRFRPVELFEDLRQEYGEDNRSKEIQKPLETIKLIKTNVLKTNFRTERGMLSITDFMPVGSKKRPGAKAVLRKVSADKGRPEVEVVFCP